MDVTEGQGRNASLGITVFLRSNGYIPQNHLGQHFFNWGHSHSNTKEDCTLFLFQRDDFFADVSRAEFEDGSIQRWNVGDHTKKSYGYSFAVVRFLENSTLWLQLQSLLITLGLSYAWTMGSFTNKAWVRWLQHWVHIEVINCAQNAFYTKLQTLKRSCTV